uniref:Uncharacterized protein n=1 Tax=Panagrolaimus sp. JU765 TaxID=591449 RepID=A0AC34REY2_9BILA
MEAVHSRNEKAHAHPWKIRNVKTLERLSIGQRTPVGKVANLIRQFTDETSRETNGKKWSGTYKRLLNLRDEMHEKESKPGSRVYDFRMYDLVLDHEKPTLGPKARRTPQGLMINSRNASFRNTEQNTKILSPRLAPLMPDKAPAKDEILSPTVFALYDDDKHNKSIASIPSILKATGIGKSDRESIVDLIMSLSKTTKVVEETLDFLNNMNFVGVEKPIMTATEKIAKSFDGISESLTAQQRLEMDRKGFTFMEKHQMQQLYRDESFNFPEEALDFDDYHKLKPHEREEALWSRIERIAINLPDEHPRVKRQFKTLSVLAPTILAPYMFSPVYGFTVLGPTILSPNIFSPLILNPAVLSPYILSPAVAMPFILSPYLLSPYMMAPFIINPYVLSPNVLNPYILSPIILSPLVLSPDVLSPQVLGGAILSPSVASPAVLTESVLMGNVLSPTFLS